jgi:hypothetical protein
MSSTCVQHVQHIQIKLTYINTDMIWMFEKLNYYYLLSNTHTKGKQIHGNNHI